MDKSKIIRFFSLCTAINLMVAFQNCAGSQDSHQSVQGTQASTSQSSNDLVKTFGDQITALFTQVMGRPPTQQELEQYSSLLAAGITEAQLRLNLANSDEAIAKIKELILQNLGNNNQALQDMLIKLLGTNTNLDAIINLIKGLS